MDDFRSDVFTVPTKAMQQAIATCSWGDLVFDLDETTAAFLERVATLTGKPTASFMVSGTMANQIGVRINLNDPPYSLICDERAHIYCHEAAGLATLSQTMVTPVMPKNGLYLTLEDIKPRLVEEDVHCAPTRLICLENTLSGVVMPIDEIRRISEFARSKGIRMHLDGARLWNAHIATGVSIEEYCSHFDTVSLCFSKGLCAPVGSVLVGGEREIAKANWFRKQQGGGIRQSGWLAACANQGLDEVLPRLAETHASAKWLANELEQVGVKLQLPCDTSFVVYNAAASGLDPDVVRETAAQQGLKLWGERICIHASISQENVEKLAAVFRQLKAKA